MTPAPRRVVFLSAILTHYRVGFHTRVRELLADQGIEYVIAYGQPHPKLSSKGDLATVSWGTEVHNSYIGVGGSYLIWQHALGLLSGADMVILGQENRNLVNYIFQTLPRVMRPCVCFFGHGRNFQARDQNSRAELWKRYWAAKVDWWFGYTEETKRIVVGLGFPEERITVFNNAVDTSGLAELYKGLSINDVARARAQIGLQGENIGVYVGGLYSEKRLDFLLEALDLIRKRVTDFEFIAVGGGPDLPILSSAAKTRPWLKVMGPKFGTEKVELMALGKLFLIPGLVGLAILDAGVMGLPIVTTDYPYHSPEIAYLTDGHNGIISRPWTDATAYSNAVVDFLTGDPERLQRMREAARTTAMTYTIEAMAERFAQGVLKALEK